MSSIANGAARAKNNSVYVPVSATGGINNILAIIAQCSDEDKARNVNWYRQAHRDAVTMAHKYKMDLWTVAQVLSVISPQRLWERNVRDAELTILAYALPASDRVAYLAMHRVAAPSGYSCFNRAWEILAGERELKMDGGPKTYNFARTIESPDTWMGVTVDSHAVALWSDEYQSPGTYQIPLSVYKRVAADYETVAAMLGMLPSEVQAITWDKRRELLAEIGR